jgi:hypothetical protein
MRPCASLFKISPDSPPAGERRRVVHPLRSGATFSVLPRTAVRVRLAAAFSGLWLRRVFFRVRGFIGFDFARAAWVNASQRP